MAKRSYRTIFWHVQVPRATSRGCTFFADIDMNLQLFRLFYNSVRPHSNLDGKTPAEAWTQKTTMRKVEATSSASGTVCWKVSICLRNHRESKCYQLTANGSMSTLICVHCCVLRLIRCLKKRFGKVFGAEGVPDHRGQTQGAICPSKISEKQRRQALDGCGQDSVHDDNSIAKLSRFIQRLR